MNTGLGTQISQSQQMRLSPKMVEEIKILQMSNVELLQYIEAQLNENSEICSTTARYVSRQSGSLNEICNLRADI